MASSSKFGWIIICIDINNFRQIVQFGNEKQMSKYCRAFSFVTKNNTNDTTNWIPINCVV